MKSKNKYLQAIMKNLPPDVIMLDSPYREYDHLSCPHCTKLTDSFDALCEKYPDGIPFEIWNEANSCDDYERKKYPKIPKQPS